jgi:hypothetical protein
MKRILIIAIVGVMLAGCMPKMTAPNSEELQIERIFQVRNLDKDEIFERSKMWMAKNFKSAKSVIEYENKEKGVIIGNGTTDIYIKITLPRIVATFTMQEDIKDGKVRLKIDNVQQAGGYPIYSEFKKPVQNEIELLTYGLQIYLTNPTNREDW